jgi:hypothetical protein
MPAPNPREEPVTSAIFPFKLNLSNIKIQSLPVRVSLIKFGYPLDIPSEAKEAAEKVLFFCRQYEKHPSGAKAHPFLMLHLWPD